MCIDTFENVVYIIGVPRKGKVKEMTLKKGSRIKQIRRNERKGFENTTANSELVYEVTRVNKKTYSLTCVDGYAKGTGCYLYKEFNNSIDEYGTVTEWVIM